MSETGNEDQPYCSNCGYMLIGLTESSKCPECGKPIVEVLMRKSFGLRGKRYQSRAKIFGYPVISIAQGAHGSETKGHAKGLIAIGDFATGGIAIGGLACGVVAIGGLSIGVCSVGGMSVGLLAAMGGGAFSGGIAIGGLAVGTIASGGGAIGLIAQGGGAIGMITRDGRGVSTEDAEVFKQLKWLMGPPIGNRGAPGIFVPAIWGLVVSIFFAAVIGLLAMFRLRREKD